MKIVYEFRFLIKPLRPQLLDFGRRFHTCIASDVVRNNRSISCLSTSTPQYGRLPIGPSSTLLIEASKALQG